MVDAVLTTKITTKKKKRFLFSVHTIAIQLLAEVGGSYVMGLSCGEALHLFHNGIQLLAFLLEDLLIMAQLAVEFLKPFL